MRNVLDEACRKNQNTHFMFKNSFSENLTFYDIMPRNMVKTEGPQMTSQYGAYALRAALARLHAHAHAPGYLHARTHTHAHRPISNTSCSPRQQEFANAPQCYVIRTLSLLFQFLV
jgi:hypothetical protein